MKTLVILLTALTTWSVQAAPLKQTLECGSGSPSAGLVRIDLDNSTFREGSGFTDAVDGRLYFEYSSVARMACDGIIQNGNFNVDCVGLYAGMREPTVVKIRGEGDHVVARWTTAQVYGHRAMVSECVVK